jgi:flagellar biosynthetic protein FliQ
MSVAEISDIGRELMLTALLLTLPVVLVGLSIGLVVSIFQAVTSINEQTLTFAPRIVAVALTLVIATPWTLKVLLAFTHQMFGHLTEAMH